MSNHTDVQAVLVHLQDAVDPLAAASLRFVDPGASLDPLSLADIETIGQAILTALISLHLALDGLQQATASRANVA